MINTFLNNYFGFNRQQRNGLLLLIGISFFLLVVRLVYPYFIKPDDLIIRHIDVIRSNSDSILSKDKNGVTVREKRPFKFDPNTVSYDEMVMLGFPVKTAKTLLTFRTKGFKFTKSE